MKISSNLHNFSLMPLLTFVSVIGTQIHILSTSATPLIETTFNIDAFNTTKKLHLPSDAAATASISSSSSLSSAATGGTTPTFTSASSSSYYDSKTSIVMTDTTSGNGVHSSSSSSTSHTATVGSLTSSSNSNSNGGSSSTSAMPYGTLTSSTLNKSLTSTSKIPLEFGLSRKWMGSDAVSFRGFAPSAATSSLGGSSGSGVAVDRPRTFRNKHHHEHHWGPFFEEPQLNSTTSGDNVVSTAHLYTEAALNCRVGMLKDKTVMWVRRTTEKVSLLTVGNVTYSGDPRIRVKFQYPNNWRLLINPTHREDAGVYMCQVSTHPPRVFTTNLTILEPPLRLIDEQEREVGDRYYKAGSTIDLQCQISRSFLVKEKLKILKSIQPLDQNQTTKANAHKGHNTNTQRLGASYNELIMSNGNANGTKQGQAMEKQFNNFIFWTKDDETLPATAVKRSSATEKWLTSRISIPDARLADSGNYTCSIGKLFAAIVQVQVLTGELPAAVQHNAAPPLMTPSSWLLLLLLRWTFQLITVLPLMLMRGTYRLPHELAYK